MDFIDQLRERVKMSAVFRELFYKLLKTKSLNGNSFYNYFYRRRIKRIISAHEEFPKTVAVESSAYCNSRCIMCPSSTMSRKKGIMSWSRFADIADECAEHGVQKLYLSGFGESLLDKGLEEKVSYAHSRGVNTSIVTNASLLDRSRALGLIEAGLDEVNVSLDGASADVYNRIRVGLDFDSVVENVRTLASARRGGRPRIQIEMVLLGSNSSQIPALRREWARVADSILVRQPQDWLKSVSLDPVVYTPHRGREGAWPPCIYPFTQLSVYWDGTVPVCCLDYDAEGSVGVQGSESLYAIWHGEKLKSCREKHLTRKGNLPPPCDRCSYFSVWW